MSVTVRQVIGLPLLTAGRLVAGEAGLDRTVRWVYITEIPDVARFLKGSELVLTHLIFLRDQPEAVHRRFVRELAAVKCSGLLVELGRIWPRLPAAILEEANLLGLPVYVLDREVRFVEITETFLQILVKEQGLPALLRAIYEVVGAPVLLLPAEAGEPGWSYPRQPARRAAGEDLLTGLLAGGSPWPWRPGASST